MTSSARAMRDIAARTGIEESGEEWHGLTGSGAEGMVDLVNLLAGAHAEHALVLDQYHQIVSPVVHEMVTLLLDYPPPLLHLVIAARSEPPLPLARMRARGQLLTLDLRY